MKIILKNMDEFSEKNGLICHSNVKIKIKINPPSNKKLKNKIH
jgi:hypothetical protein